MTIAQVDSMLGFERDFAFCDDQDTLGIENQGRVNRSLLTQEHIGRTSYSAYIRHVQYGTYQDKPACLIGIDFSFRFPSRSSSRFTYAEVEVTFEDALDLHKPSRRSTDASLDPVVANFAPKYIQGQVTERENETAFDIEVPVAFEFPFGSAGITTKWSTKTSMTQTGRLEVNGQLAQDDEHDDGANSITWDLTENPISKDGILRSFRGVALLFCRPGKPFWMHASVKPVVSFSLDPRRVLTKRLIGTEDEPVLLDGHTTLGSSSCLAHSQFDAEEFPWAEVLNFPKSLGSSTP